MATTQATVSVSLIAGEDLTDSIYSLLYVDNSGKVKRTSAATDIPIGVLAENPGPEAVGEYSVPVVLLQGIIKMTAGEPIAAGSLVIVDPDVTHLGKVSSVASVVAVAPGVAVGVALESAAIGDIFRVIAQTYT